MHHWMLSSERKGQNLTLSKIANPKFSQYYIRGYLSQLTNFCQRTVHLGQPTLVIFLTNSIVFAIIIFSIMLWIVNQPVMTEDAITIEELKCLEVYYFVDVHSESLSN